MELNLGIPRTMSIGLLILFVQMFLWVGADWIYGIAATTMKNILLIYLVLQALILAVFAKGLPTLRTSVSRGLFNFFFMFLLFSIFMLPLLAVKLYGAGLETIKGIVAGIGIMQAVVVAYTEEIIFRYVLPIQARLGDIVSNILFGFFHVPILLLTGAPVMFAGVLAVLGLVFSLVRTKFGIEGAWGAHTAYNFAVLGLTAQMLGGVTWS